MKYSVMSNAVWMMSEKIVSVFGVIFVTSYVAKSFGPAIFGQMAFSASLFSIVQTVAIFGTETILFKRISKSAHKGVRLMGVAKKMRMSILLVLSIPLLAWVWYRMSVNFAVFAMASFLAALFVTQDTFSVYNNARLVSRYNTLANAAGMTFSFILSFFIAWWQLNPFFLAFPMVSATLIPYLIKRAIFYQGHQPVTMQTKGNSKYLRYLLYAGLPLAISSIFVSIQVKAAQFFLVSVGSEKEIGLFSAASTIAASWIFIPVAIITSCFTEIFRQRTSIALKLAARLHGYVMAVSLCMLLFIAIYGEKIIMVLYGQDYTQSGRLITLLSLATCLSAMGTVAWRYMVKEGGFNYLLMKIISLLVISLPISYLLISFGGLMGAAWSVLITELLSLTVMNYFFKSGVIMKIQLSSLNYKIYR